MTSNVKRSRPSVTEWQHKTQELYNNTKNLYDELSSAKASLLNGTDSTKSLSEIQQRAEQITEFSEGEEIQAIKAYHVELITSDDSIKAHIESNFESWGESAKALEGRQAEINSFRDKIFGYKEKVETGEKDEEGNPLTTIKDVPGLSAEIDQFYERMTLDAEDKQTELENLHKKYDKKIKKLLPGATSAGLAWAYEKTSNKYSWLAFAMNIGFLFLIILLVGLGFLSTFPDAVNPSLPFVTVENIDKIKSYFMSLFVLPVSFPLIWAALVFQKRAKNYIRLHSEYQHKADLCKTFDGFKKAAEEESDKKLIELLLATMVTASAFNPSEHLDSSSVSTPIKDILEEFKKLVNWNDS